MGDPLAASNHIFRPENIFVTGFGARRPGTGWQYYLPFIKRQSQPYPDGSFPDSHVKFALSLSDGRIFVTTHYGECALIDLVADEVVARARIKCNPTMIQLSADCRHLFIQDN